jgi:Mg-chelatase subunit ChlD
MSRKWLATACAVGCIVSAGCTRTSDDAPPSRAEDSRIAQQLQPESAVVPREGLAAAILIDVSGSMNETVAGADGKPDRKINVARRAAQDLVEQFARYAEDHRDEPVMLGLYEFSERSGETDCRPIVAMSAPDRARAASALASVKADGGTPIGNAMIAGKRELDRAGLSRRHLLVVTDGENTDGFKPEDVAAAMGVRPEAERPSIYFVAFDVEQARFNRVRDAGGLVLGAADGRELASTLDALLRGKILVEK